MVSDLVRERRLKKLAYMVEQKKLHGQWSPPLKRPRGCQLYRHFDKNGTLLYVGISLNSMSRLISHKTCAKWFDQIQTIKIEHFSNRPEAMRREQEIISEEGPIYNISFNKNPLPREYPLIVKKT